MGDDGNRQVALTLERLGVVLGLDAEQFKALLDLGAQQDANLDGINGAINKLAEGIAPVDSSLAAEIQSLKEVVSVGLFDVRQSVVDLNNTIHERSVDLAKWLAAIALAAANPENNEAAVQAKIDEITANIRTSSDVVEDAINQDQTK